MFHFRVERGLARVVAIVTQCRCEVARGHFMVSISSFEDTAPFAHCHSVFTGVHHPSRTVHTIAINTNPKNVPSTSQLIADSVSVCSIGVAV